MTSTLYGGTERYNLFLSSLFNLMSKLFKMDLIISIFIFSPINLLTLSILNSMLVYFISFGYKSIIELDICPLQISFISKAALFKA